MCLIPNCNRTMAIVCGHSWDTWDMSGLLIAQRARTCVETNIEKRVSRVPAWALHRAAPWPAPLVRSGWPLLRAASCRSS